MFKNFPSGTQGTLQLLTHLANGGIVVNQYGTKVRLDSFGGQVVDHSGSISKSRKTYYQFDSPEYWRPYGSIIDAMKVLANVHAYN